MPVTVISGAPGAGKSYYACLEIKKEAETGRQIYTNLVLQQSFLDEYPNVHYVADSEISLFWQELPENALFVVDEALIFYSKDFLKEKDEKSLFDAFKAWLATHRHYGQDVIFIVQSYFLLSGVVKAMADVMIKLHNKSHLGFKSAYVMEFYSPIFAKEPYQTKKALYKKEVFAMYRSVLPGSMLAKKGGKNLLFQPYVYIPLAAAVFGLFAMGSVFDRAADVAQAKPEPARTIPAPVQPVAVQPVAAPVEPVEPSFDEKYRRALSAHVVGFANDKIVIEFGDGLYVLKSGDSFGGCIFAKNLDYGVAGIYRLCGQDKVEVF